MIAVLLETFQFRTEPSGAVSGVADVQRDDTEGVPGSHIVNRSYKIGRTAKLNKYKVLFAPSQICKFLI